MRRLSWVVSVLVCATGSAWAEGEIVFEGVEEEEEATVEQSVQPEEVADQLLSAAVGVDAGGRVSPGGVKLSGSHLYRLSERDWLRSSLSLTFGGGGSCTLDMGATDCNDGHLSGLAIGAGANVRRLFAPLWGATPYAELGLSAKLIRFDDGVRGFALPVWFAGGARKSVHDGIAVFGTASVEAGFGRFNQMLGWEPHVTVGLQGGVEFDWL